MAGTSEIIGKGGWTYSWIAVLSLVAAGCQDKTSSETAPSKAVPAAAPKPNSANVAAGMSFVRGRVKVSGPLPQMAPLKRAADPACAHMPEVEESVKVKDGNLAGAVVEILGAGTFDGGLPAAHRPNHRENGSGRKQLREQDRVHPAPEQPMLVGTG